LVSTASFTGSVRNTFNARTYCFEAQSLYLKAKASSQLANPVFAAQGGGQTNGDGGGGGGVVRAAQTNRNGSRDNGGVEVVLATGLVAEIP